MMAIVMQVLPLRDCKACVGTCSARNAVSLCMHVCLLLQDLVQSCVRGERGEVKDLC